MAATIACGLAPWNKFAKQARETALAAAVALDAPLLRSWLRWTIPNSAAALPHGREAHRPRSISAQMSPYALGQTALSARARCRPSKSCCKTLHLWCAARQCGALSRLAPNQVVDGSE